jgi:fatty acid desaturase
MKTLRHEFQLERVQWRDLVPLTTFERMWELTLPLPWLALALGCYESGWWAPGLLCSFYFFLTGLRVSHNAQHYSLGLSRISQDLVLLVLSVLMLASMHAVQATHLHHHRHCLAEEDSEGETARLVWWRALLAGPLFPLRLHRAAWQLASPIKRGWIAVELCGIAVVLLAGLLSTDSLGWRWHWAAMLVGECFTAFFAVWTVHHGCDAQEPGRTQRGQWLSIVSYSMFFHAEHHLFPAVPTAHLPELSRRLDDVAPRISERQVLRLGLARRLRGQVPGVSTNRIAHE